MPYTISDCLKNMRAAFSKDEAMRWGFLIQMAFAKLELNQEINQAMDKILNSKGIPPIVVETEKCPNRNSDMPPTLINYIFKDEFRQEQLEKLWSWIKEYLIDNITHPYHYLSLLLFLENHHSRFLQNKHISNINLENQMTAWYPKAKVTCSADAIGTYRNGFFTSTDFSYITWINTDGTPPPGYQYKKDQSMPGFEKLVKYCNNLEICMPELKI